MTRRLLRVVLSISFLIVVGLAVAGRFPSTTLSGQTAATAVPSTKNGEWPHYAADLERHAGIRRSIRSTAPNFNKLEVAWRFKTDSFGPFPEFKLEGTPLMVKGVLYTTAGTRRSVIALDAKTGELIWTHSIREGTRAAQVAAPALGPRRVVLDRRQGRRAHHLHDDRLSPRLAQRQDRAADQLVRHERRRRSEERRREGHEPADRSRERRDRHPLDAGRRRATWSSSDRRSAKA